MSFIFVAAYWPCLSQTEGWWWSWCAYYGAWALSTGDAELPTAACGARVSASDAFDLATTEMIQMYGGVGYTWEYDCHLFYRRARGLGHALGSATEWREKLIQRLEDS